MTYQNLDKGSFSAAIELFNLFFSSLKSLIHLILTNWFEAKLMGSFWWRPSGPLATSRRVQPSLYTYTKKIQFHIWDHAEHICYQKRCRSKYLHPTGQNDLLAFRIEQIRNDIMTNRRILSTKWGQVLFRVQRFQVRILSALFDRATWGVKVALTRAILRVFLGQVDQRNWILSA